jgi:hypothetical protein
MDVSPLMLADFAKLAPLARAWSARAVHDAGPDELAALVRAVEPCIEELNDFLDVQEAPLEAWPEELRDLRHLTDLFNEAAFDDEVWRRAFPGGTA